MFQEQTFIKITVLHLSLHFLQEHQRVWRVIHTDPRWPPSSAPQPGTRNKDNIMLTPGKINTCKAESKKMETNPLIYMSSAEVKVTATHFKVFWISALLYKAGIWREWKTLEQLAFCFDQVQQ